MARSHNENNKGNNPDKKNLLFRNDFAFNTPNSKDKDLLYDNDQH